MKVAARRRFGISFFAGRDSQDPGTRTCNERRSDDGTLPLLGSHYVTETRYRSSQAAEGRRMSDENGQDTLVK